MKNSAPRFVQPEYPYRRSADQVASTRVHHPVVVIGAGPVGLTAALDLADRGLPVVLLDDNNTVSVGSRAVCHAKGTLEILDRFGIAERMVEHGCCWNVGKVFRRDRLAYQFELVPERGFKMPGMVNLQQYYLEQWLVEAAEQRPYLDLRWQHRVMSVTQDDYRVSLEVDTPEGKYAITADWVVACDGCNSNVREWVGADFKGESFSDRFLIADVKMQADFPTERWFWFDPPFHPGRSVLLHRQPDDIWRIDFQLGPDANPDQERQPERVIPRVQEMLGLEVDFELEWVSVYQFSCRRVERLRHGRILFAGDAAHQVSPFGARGANSGIQDAANLCWKLDMVIRGEAPAALLDSYDEERGLAADDNIRESTRSTDFLVPKSSGARAFRDAVLELAEECPFARPMVNSGRLSTPSVYTGCSRITPYDGNSGGAQPGDPCPDAPVLDATGKRTWLLTLIPAHFCVLVLKENAAMAPAEVSGASVTVLRLGKDFFDADGLLRRRLGEAHDGAVLVRPDGYIAARWDTLDPESVTAAIRRATA